MSMSLMGRLIRGGGCSPRRSRAALADGWCGRRMLGRGHGKIFFYGPAGAVGGIVELYRFLEAQLVVISAAATATRRERRVHGRTWRNSFLLGAVGRVGQRLDARGGAQRRTNPETLPPRPVLIFRPAADTPLETPRGRRHDRRRLRPTASAPYGEQTIRQTWRDKLAHHDLIRDSTAAADAGPPA